ncbi:MAG TPA: transketolase, partial [Chitinophagaceae bacterium]|nr:transketolase [Chitinophagaceae bacterium]
RLIRMYKTANAGHVGSSLSCLEMIVFIRFYLMQPADEFILSKGHAAALLYSTLAEEGAISEKDIESFYKNGTYLPAHPPVNKIRGIPFATGSLGHGLSIAAGFALANKLKKQHKTIFCITSDGELNEGSTWEAALFISHHCLKDIVWFIDRNYLQGFGRTEDTMKLEPLDKKLESFGFQVAIADGHDFNSLKNAVSLFRHERPLAVICNTIKGKDLTLQDTVDCHYLPLTEADFKKLID